MENKITESAIEKFAIASVLSSLDDKIDLLHNQNKTLEASREEASCSCHRNGRGVFMVLV